MKIEEIVKKYGKYWVIEDFGAKYYRFEKTRTMGYFMMVNVEGDVRFAKKCYYDKDLDRIRFYSWTVVKDFKGKIERLKKEYNKAKIDQMKHKEQLKLKDMEQDFK